MSESAQDKVLAELVEREKERQAKTWGDVYNSLLRRGYDHGYAAYRADEWEKQRAKE